MFTIRSNTLQTHDAKDVSLTFVSPFLGIKNLYIFSSRLGIFLPLKYHYKLLAGFLNLHLANREI